MRCVSQPAGATAGVGGWMRFKARVSYTGSQLSKRSLTISPQEEERIMFIDKTGAVQIVTAVFKISGAYPYVVAHTETSNYKIYYGNTVINTENDANLSVAISAIYIGSLES